MAFCFLLSSCDKFGQQEEVYEKNALVIKPALRTKADGGIQREDGSFIYHIKAMSYSSGMYPLSPSITATSLQFYPEEITTQWPDLSKSLFDIGCLRPNEEEETKPGQFIRSLTFWVPDFEALGWKQNHFDIWMEDGKHTGENAFIADVKVKSFKYSSDPKETNINIEITTKDGDVITLSYENGAPVWNGTY